MFVSFRKLAVSSVLLLAFPFAGCSENTDNSSEILVTDVNHTTVKRQSIGNCWLYAQATWLESLLLDHTGEEVDVSESYWTWWHWYDQLVGSSTDELQTGGFWGTSANIILSKGWVTEGEFIKDEQGVEMSLRQSQALAKINQELQPGGKLARRAQRTARNVRKQLDLAFGSNMAETQQLARSAGSTAVGPNTTLAQALRGVSGKTWSYVRFPSVYGQNTVVSASVQASRKAILKRVMRALNDKKPVVMSLMIDFNALDINDQTFKKSLVDADGIGSQGGHMVVLEDYTVDNVPGYGYIGEGDVSDDMKAAALEGDIVLLKAKNSWGKNRPDRGLTDGYTRFDAAYLFSQMEWKNGDDDDNTSFYTTLTDFVLPPGY
jgi:hypothetical protein